MILVRLVAMISLLLLIPDYGSGQPNSIKPYQRSEWRHWIDEDNDCQNLRHEILIAQSSIPVTFTNNRQCTVYSGSWVGPYTGKSYELASDLDVDHVVPLAYAHEAGGYEWTFEMKQAFANDEENLLLVDDGENRSKGASGPSEYLPLESFRCEYIKIWSRIIRKYGLRVKNNDALVISSYLERCV